MLLQTSRFGQIEFEKEQVYMFPQGIPGFPKLTDFLYIETEEEVIGYLQSAEEGEVGFVVTDPFRFYPEYDFELPQSAIEELEVELPEQVRVLSIMSVKDALETATINLVAPIVLNVDRKRGKQVILSQTDYTTKHPLVRKRSEQTP